MTRALTGLLFAVTLAAEICGSGRAFAQDRFALVIGNSDYRAVMPLPNPVRDAAVVSDFLKSAGFDVTTLLNADQAGMRRAVRDFAQRLAQSDDEKTVALLYFAGHGVQVDGENYLVPVDAKIAVESDVALEAVRFGDIMDTLERIGKKSRIILLDACRNNPFGDRKTPQGLAIVNVPTGSLVMYSTSPGATAEDGSGGNSPFTEALLAAGKTPGKPIEDTLKDVRLAVNKETVGRQVPWDVSSLIEPFSFFPGGGVTAPAATGTGTGTSAGPGPSAVSGPATGGGTSSGAGNGAGPGNEAGTGAAPDQSAAVWRDKLKGVSANEAYDIAVREDRVVVYRVVLELFPRAPFIEKLRLILDRRIEMWTWYDAVNLDTIAAYEAFLKIYPDGDLAATAHRLIERARHRSAFASEVPGALGLAAASATSGTSTVIKEVPVVQTVIKEVPVEKTVTVEVPSPCRCSGPGQGSGRGSGSGSGPGPGPGLGRGSGPGPIQRGPVTTAPSSPGRAFGGGGGGGGEFHGR